MNTVAIILLAIFIRTISFLIGGVNSSLLCQITLFLFQASWIISKIFKFTATARLMLALRWWVFFTAQNIQITLTILNALTSKLLRRSLSGWLYFLWRLLVNSLIRFIKDMLRPDTAMAQLEWRLQKTLFTHLVATILRLHCLPLPNTLHYQKHMII